MVEKIGYLELIESQDSQISTNRKKERKKEIKKERQKERKKGRKKERKKERKRESQLVDSFKISYSQRCNYS